MKILKAIETTGGETEENKEEAEVETVKQTSKKEVKWNRQKVNRS